MRLPERQPPLQNLRSYPDLFGDRMFLDHDKWHGVPVTLTTALEDGTVMAIGTPTVQFLIGSKPRTEVELARYHARWLVQNGLRDVVEWLGERVTPERPVTGAEILDGIRRRLI